MNNEPIYTLSDVSTTINVKPCRVCRKKPNFRYIDIEPEMINAYEISCPHCDISYLQNWGTDKIEAAWNDRSNSIEEWKKDKTFLW